MGRHVSESMIEEQKPEGEENGGDEQEEKIEKYDKLANFITISVECK